MSIRDSAGRFGKSLKRRVVEFSQRAFLAFVFIGMTTAMFQIFVFEGAPEVKVITKEVKAAEAVKEIPAVLQRIAKCESKAGHYTNGQVTINKTMDLGKFQINVPIWSKTATQMGLDLSKPEDNEAFAVWLYENKGTEPWSSSRACWNK